MTQQTQKYWDDIFSESTSFTYSNKLLPGFNNIFKHLSSGEVLDLGCGDGRFLLKLGETSDSFKLNGVDISDVALNKLNGFAIAKGLKINLEKSSIEDYVFRKEYDLIMNCFLLHLFEIEVVLEIIEKMKKGTKIGGYNYIVSFVGIDLPDDFKCKLARFDLSHQIYGNDENWEVVELEESQASLKRDTKKLYNVEVILVKRIK